MFCVKIHNCSVKFTLLVSPIFYIFEPSALSQLFCVPIFNTKRPVPGHTVFHYQHYFSSTREK